MKHEGDKGNCLASAVCDYGEALKYALKDYQGGTIFTGDCENGCIYITGKSEEDAAYTAIYDKLAKDEITLISVEAGGDFRKAINSKCLTINYWIR